MKMLRLVALALCLFAVPAIAQQPAAPPAVVSATAPPVAAQNTITTTGSVDSSTTISIGTVAGQVLMWLAAAFSLPVGTLLTLWLKRLFTLAGVQVTQQMSDKLNSIIVNGLNDGAANAKVQLAGKGQVEVKSQIVASAVDYTQRHAAETIQALGLDPHSGEAVEAIKARIQTAINDSTVPTPAVLSAPTPQPAQAARPV